MPIKPTKSTEKLELARFQASRNMEISKSQKILSTKNKTQKFIVPSSPLPKIINNKAQLAASLLSISKKRSKEVISIYQQELKSEKQLEMSVKAQPSSGWNKREDQMHVIPIQALEQESYSDDEGYDLKSKMKTEERKQMNQKVSRVTTTQPALQNQNNRIPLKK